MAHIVELREMSDDKLEEMLENAREELFNLRFQQASARLEDYTRLKHVRREIAQLETVLRMRELAIEVAAELPEIAAVLANREWEARAFFSYEESAWLVEFSEDTATLASATVDLNRIQRRGRRARQLERPSQPVIGYEIAG